MRLGGLLVLLALAAATAPARADDFYAPPDALVDGRPGTVVWTRPAAGAVVLPDAARTDVVIFRSRGLDGRPIVSSGTVAIPRGKRPRGGWPIVSFFHVTTGGGDRCAPSRATPDNPEFERLTRADVVAGHLLRAGVAVARPDGEGIGTPGPHPYLIGASLARSQTDIVHAARAMRVGVGRRWAAAGHSEGGVAALHTAALGERLAPRLDLRAALAFAPETRIREQVDLLRHIPIAGPGADGLSALAALIISGAGTADPVLEALLGDGALSPAATALRPHVEDRCLVELTRADSWGALAPAEIPGPRFEQAKPRFYDVLDANDPRSADLANLPVRIDHGALDAVAPIALTDAMVAEQRSRGASITYRRWPTATHVDIADDTQAAPAAVAWLVARLRSG
jgi:hypothetical protein